jgi:hypothetical protein
MTVNAIFRLRQRTAKNANKPMAPSEAGDAFLRDRRFARRRPGCADNAPRTGFSRKPSIAASISTALAGRPPQLYRGGA